MEPPFDAAVSTNKNVIMPLVTEIMGSFKFHPLKLAHILELLVG